MENQPPDVAMGNHLIANCKKLSHFSHHPFLGLP
jgi:hypothetical protein